MSSRIELAKLAVDQLLQLQPTIILDTGALSGKLTTIAQDYGLVVTTSFNVGLAFGASVANAGVKYNSYSGASVVGNIKIPTTRINLSAKVDLDGISVTDKYDIISAGGISVKGSFNDTYFGVDASLTGQYGLARPSGGVSFAFTDLNTFLANQFHNELTDKFQDYGIATTSNEYWVAKKAYVDSFESDKDYNIESYMAIRQYKESGGIGLNEVTDGSIFTSSSREIEAIGGGHYLITTERVFNSGENLVDIQKVDSNGAILKTGGYRGYLINGNLSVNQVYGASISTGLNSTVPEIANGIVDRLRAEIISSEDSTVSLLDGGEGFTSLAPTDGTGYDEVGMGIDISTNFSHSSLEAEYQSEDIIIGNLIEDGRVISGGNYFVDSQSVNDVGFYADINIEIADGSTPGREGLTIGGSSDFISDVFSSENLVPLPGSDGNTYYNPDIVVNTAAANSFQPTFAEVDPLILDLDGDGIELTPFNEQFLFFDVDNDGALEQTGWVGADDAILVHDLNGDGDINNITEMLSEYYGAAYGTGAIYANGFEALATLDSNNDGIFNASDTQFGSLKIWQDANSDGKTDAGELTSLSDAGISSITLSNTQDGAFVGGNEVRSNSTYTRDDGTSAAIASVNFIVNPNGLLYSDDGTVVTSEDGNVSTYAASDIAGETVDVAAKGVTSAIGNIGNDTLVGDAGDNWLTGNLGEDALSGGAGNDYLIADAEDIANTQDNIQGGSGFDIVQFVGPKGVAFNLQQSQVEQVIGTNQADILVSGSTDHSIIVGGGGDDIIIGGTNDDVLNGEEGNDAINGNSGNDLIRGHRGADRLSGDDGEDIIFGGQGDDLLLGGAGEDLLRGDEGNDVLDGGDGYDVAEYAGSYGDYNVVKNSDDSYTVTDLRSNGRDGVDWLTNIEALNFSDIKEIQIADDNPLPVKDIVNIDAQADGRTYIISSAQLLANDLDYQGDALSISEIFGPEGGTASLSSDKSQITFVVDEGFDGIPSFSYKIKDVDGTSSIQVGIIGDASGATAEMTAQVRLVLEQHPDDPLFIDQWYLPEINVISAWQDYTGKGIDVGVFEVGPWDGQEYGQIDYTHTDLDGNVDEEWLRTVNPHITPTTHATRVAGVIAAERNDEGGVGVAYDATLFGENLRNKDDDGNNRDFSAIFNWQNYDVVNNSWGFNDQFYYDYVEHNGSFTAIAKYPESEGQPAYYTALELAADLGRNGLGTIVVNAAGNERQQGFNTNDFEFTSSRIAITVGAINAEGDLGNLQIAADPFSNPGASILVSAPGSNVTSTSRLLENDNGSTFGNEYDSTQGTSFAAPIVSGVVALMLEANYQLGYRDVQEILALSAVNIDDANTVWNTNGAGNWNGGGMHYSQDYGFGLVDARAAVRLAETWTSQGTWDNEAHVEAQSGDINLAIPDGSSSVSNSINVSGSFDIDIENIEVTFDLEHQNAGDLEITLIGPDGNKSILLNRPGVSLSDSSDRGFGSFNQVWTATTTNHWGENANGLWTLEVRDLVSGETGQINSWGIHLYGDKKEISESYYFTDEYSEIADNGRRVVTDTNGGIDTLNASAVTANSIIDLRYGMQSTIDGQAVTLATTTYNANPLGGIENAFGGDGNDIIVGNSARNTLSGGRGDDTLYAVSENFVVTNLVRLGANYTPVQLPFGVNAIGIDFNNVGSFLNTRGYFSYVNGQINAPNVIKGFEVGRDYIYFGDTIIKLNQVYSSKLTINGNVFTIVKTAYGGAIILEGVSLSSSELSDILVTQDNNPRGDTLIGDQGDDVLYGSNANDKLEGGDGADTIYGGYGRDVAVYEGSSADYKVVARSDGKFDVYLRSEISSGIFDTLDSVERLRFDDGEINIGSMIFNDAPFVNTEIGDYIGTEDIDVSITIPSDSFIDLEGDTLVYTAKLADGSGLPTWLAFNSSTRSFAGTPPENYSGTIEITVTATEPSGASASQQFSLTLNPTVDTILGTSGDDILIGYDDADILNGGDGNDILIGGSGADTLNGGDGIDTISYYDSEEAVSINLETGFADGGDATGDVFTSIEQIYGSNLGDDILVGDTGDNLLNGYGGNDTLVGGAGNDTLIGGAGDDTLVGGVGNDILDGGAGDDTIYLDSNGSDTVRYSAGYSTDTIRSFQSNGATSTSHKIEIDVNGIDNFDDLLEIANNDDSGSVSFDFGGGDMLIIEGVQLAALDRDAFTFF